MPDNKVRYLITKETISYKWCSTCKGSGRFKRGTYEGYCSHCGGNGKEKLIHKTEISLLQALKELKLIK